MFINMSILEKEMLKKLVVNSMGKWYYNTEIGGNEKDKNKNKCYLYHFLTYINI